MKAGALVLACVALLGVASTVQAGLWWTSTGTLIVGAQAPPIVFDWGANANRSRYVGDLALSPDRTAFSATFKGRAGAEMVVLDVLRLQNRGGPVNVTLTGDAISSARVLALEWRVEDGGSDVGTLDHKASEPRLAFHIPSGTTYQMALHTAFAPGAGRGDGTPFGVRVTVS